LKKSMAKQTERKKAMATEDQETAKKKIIQRYQRPEIFQMNLIAGNFSGYLLQKTWGL